MSKEASPPWLNSEDAQPLTDKAAASHVGNIPQQEGQNASGYGPLVHLAMHIITMSLCCLMAATAIIGLEYIDGVEASGKLFIAAYMMFFSTLLFCFELTQIKKVEWIEHMLQRNFGFLYGAMGKAFFIIFVAFLSFGLGEPTTLTSVTGCLMAAFGFLHLALYLKYPEWFE